ncbi:isomerase [Streptomyces sp. 549]|uniref:5-carboxymethyl-2-hydroxymuconate Delta-isomerase n=1 Tax=Streptomyces sp. 549 TaxID=3049076 RepID=UPI0024C3F114|nr:isomerase [Streptomyces sp. 549]MDK1474079.1 isomerase [Streptomyces sp. 549]
MPHLTVDYAAPLAGSLDPRAFGLELHAVVEATTGATTAACKTRFRQIEHSVIADAAGAAEHTDMVHIEIRLLAGRTAEVKARLADAVLELTTRSLTPDTGRILDVSVHVADLDRETYRAARTGERS